MSETADPIKAADRLGTPTLAEVAMLHLWAVLCRRDPTLLDAVLDRARDKALAATVIRLHGKDDHPDWARVFADAETRMSSAGEMLRHELAAMPAVKVKKRKKR